MDESELKNLKVAELKAKLTEAGLSTTGVKSDLIARLLEHGAKGAQPTEAAPTTEAGPPAAATKAQPESAEPQSTLESTAPAKATDPNEELEKRKARAARFGSQAVDGGEATDKKIDRAQRFGVEAAETNVDKLDQALSGKRERQPRGGRKKIPEGLEQAPKKTASKSNDATKSKTGTTLDPAEEEKKRKRMEKYGVEAESSKKAKV